MTSNEDGEAFIDLKFLTRNVGTFNTLELSEYGNF